MQRSGKTFRCKHLRRMRIGWPPTGARRDNALEVYRPILTGRVRFEAAVASLVLPIATSRSSVVRPRAPLSPGPHYAAPRSVVEISYLSPASRLACRWVIG